MTVPGNIEKTNTEETNAGVTHSEDLLVGKPPTNFDEYSFGSSEDEDIELKDNDKKTAHNSFNTIFDMSILQSSIEKSKDALDLVVGKEVVMVVGKTGGKAEKG